MSKSVREQMPSTAAFLDSLRAAFGAEMINAQVRKGLNGEATFWARENGQIIGTRDLSANSVLKWDERGIGYWDTPDWVIEAREFAKRRGVNIAPADPADLRDAVREADELRAFIQAAKQKRKSADVCTATEKGTA